MKFGEKYELLESITTGGVETFVANDKVRGERVLVHILECEAQKPNQPTVQWVLEAFRRVAPEPAALVLETGRYSGTLYGYLVTKMPVEAALTKWVHMYRAQARETQEIPAALAKPTVESESPTAEVSVKQRPEVPGAMNPSAFRDFSATPKSGRPSMPSTETERPAQALPNPKPAGDRSEIRPAPDWNAVSPRVSAPAKADPNVGSSVDSFSSAFAPRNLPSEMKSPATNDGPKPGEFTRFFQGPFRVDGPSETPVTPPQHIEPPGKNVGEFTAMFNPPRPEEPLPGGSVAGNESPGMGFTGWFSNPNVAPRTSSTPAALPSDGLPKSVFDETPAFPTPPKEPFVPPSPLPYAAPPIVSLPAPVFPTPPPPAFPTPPPPVSKIETPPIMPRAGSALDGATNAFNRRASEPAPSQPAPPSGPGAYTQVISPRRPADPVGTQKPAAPNSPASGYPLPSMPSVPAIAPPPMPAAPAMPKMAVPAAPKPPKVSIPEPTVSYWPLILTLTVLFFIAVLLVLYFALKH